MIKDILFLKCGFVNTIVNHFWLVFLKYLFWGQDYQFTALFRPILRCTFLIYINFLAAEITLSFFRGLNALICYLLCLHFNVYSNSYLGIKIDES